MSLSNGPFQGKESGGVIARFMKDELFPVMNELKKLSIDVSNFKAGFLESLTRNNGRKFENSYKGISVKFIKLYDKWSTPDLLFKELNIDADDPRQFGAVMADYMNSQQAVMWHINEGFRLLAYTDGILTVQATASYNRTSISLSLLAIVISIVVGTFFGI